MEWWEIMVQWNGSLMSGGNELVRGQGEWRWHAGWGVLTRVRGGCKPDFVWRS